MEKINSAAIEHKGTTIRAVEIADAEYYRGIELVLAHEGVDIGAVRFEIDITEKKFQALWWRPSKDFWAMEPDKISEIPLGDLPKIVAAMTKKDGV